MGSLAELTHAVFSAHAEVVPAKHAHQATSARILRARGGSSPIYLAEYRAPGILRARGGSSYQSS